MKTQFLIPVLSSFVLLYSCKLNVDHPIEFEPCWTTIGSAGTVDEDPNGVVNLGRTALPIFIPHDQAYPGNAVDQLEPFDGVVSIDPGAASAHHSIRYNIGQFIEPRAGTADVLLVLKVRYLVKDKSRERVLVMLKRYAIFTPVNNELGDVIKLFDSFDHGASPDFQTQEVVVNISSHPVRGFFNHLDNAYYIDVLLIKYEQDQGPGQARGGVDPPAVAAVQLCGSVRVP